MLHLLEKRLGFVFFPFGDVKLGQRSAGIRVLGIGGDHDLDLLFGFGIASARLIEGGQRQVGIGGIGFEVNRLFVVYLSGFGLVALGLKQRQVQIEIAAIWGQCDRLLGLCNGLVKPLFGRQKIGHHEMGVRIAGLL